MTPYQILQVEPDASDEAIRAAYLAAVKRCPPERDPVRFQRFADAYERIKDAQSRLTLILEPAPCESESPAEVLADQFRHERGLPKDIERLKAFLRHLS